MIVPEHFRTQIAGNFYVDTPNLIVCDDEPILRVDRDDSNSRLHVRLTIYDSDGNYTAQIEDDDVIDGADDDYDVALTEKSFLVREKSTGRTVCEIRRSAASRQTDLDVFVLTHSPSGFFIHANPKQSNARVRTDGETHRNLDAALRLS